MNRLSLCKSIASLVAVPFAAFAAMRAEDHLAALNLPTALVLGMQLLIVLFAYVVIYHVGSLLLCCRFVRRFLLGKQWIEGTWMDLVRVKGKLQKIGVLRIEVGEHSVHVSGFNYTPDGLLEDSFRTQMTLFEWPQLWICFRSDAKTVGSPISGGIGQLHFEPRDGPPDRYFGFCQTFTGKRGDCTGWRVKDSERIKMLDDPLEAKQLIAQVVEKELASTPKQELPDEKPAKPQSPTNGKQGDIPADVARTV